MDVDLGLLLVTAASIGCIHTLLGPDHYLPFVAMSAARRWSRRRTLWITSLCGAGHVLGSVVIGFVGIAIGVSLTRLEWLEGLRGDAAAWLLTGFGVAYLAWGLKKAWRARPHTHPHFHGDGSIHEHSHGHEACTCIRTCNRWRHHRRTVTSAVMRTRTSPRPRCAASPPGRCS